MQFTNKLYEGEGVDTKQDGRGLKTDEVGGGRTEED